MMIKKFVFFFIENLIMKIRSLFWKRDCRIILIGSWFGQRFADNSRYLFQYLNENKNKLNLEKIVWVTRSEKVLSTLSQMGYEVYLMDSKESIYFHKKAGIHIVCNSSSGNGDILGHYSYGAKKINLWHGVGIKAVGYASNASKKTNKFFLYKLFEILYAKSFLFRSLISKGGWSNCFYLATSPFSKQSLIKSFLLKNEFIIQSNYPRNCNCITKTVEEKKIVVHMKSFKKTILFLPTFRDKKSSYNPGCVSEALKKYCEKNNYLLIQKLHQADRHLIKTESKNILSLNAEFDINVILPHIDVLITDFSSVAFDAMFFFKPVVYFVPDIKEYMMSDNGFLDDPFNFMIGEWVYQSEMLENVIKKFFEKTFEPNQNYLTVRKKMWDNNKSIEEIWEDICIKTT